MHKNSSINMSTMMEVEPETNNENVDSSNSAAALDVNNVYSKENKPTNAADAEGEGIVAMTDVRSNSNNASVVFSPELLKMYYSRLFPFGLLHSWLSYDPTKKHPLVFSRREFSMTIEPTPGEEIYIRYQSFSSEEELTNAIMKRRPTKIDLGAVFTHPPKDHKMIQKGKLMPVQRELVFDIDLTDYDDIRHCGCSGAQICHKCWVFMTMAVEVMDRGLKEDFGFEHVAWFYSGRRGVHAWVCDETARTLSNEGRNAVASYFEVNLGTENNKEVEIPLPLHPSLQRAYDILEPWFISDILPASGHGLLASEDRWKDLLQMMPEQGENIASLLENKWRNNKSSTPEEKWKQLKQYIRVAVNKNSESNSKAAKKMNAKESAKLEHWPIEVVFRHTYPRLDINVSKTMNHLLKSPFCVHPKTGRVCVPIQPERVKQFDPFVVPNLSQLMDELDQFEKCDEDEKEQTPDPKFDWQKTSLKKYFEPFQYTFLEPMLKEIRKHDKMEAEHEAALRGDF